jgi:hypothetical protein
VSLDVFGLGQETGDVFIRVNGISIYLLPRTFKVANETSTACDRRDRLAVDTSTPPQNFKDHRIVCAKSRKALDVHLQATLWATIPSRIVRIAVITDENFRANKERKSEIWGSKNHSYTGFSIPVSIEFFALETCQALVAAWEHPAVQARVRSFRPCGLLAHRTHQQHG